METKIFTHHIVFLRIKMGESSHDIRPLSFENFRCWMKPLARYFCKFSKGQCGTRCLMENRFSQTMKHSLWSCHFYNLIFFNLTRYLTLSAPTPKNGQTRSNNSSSLCRQIVGVCLPILWCCRLKGQLLASAHIWWENK